MSLKDHTNSIHHYNQVLPYSNPKRTSQSDTYLIHQDKHSKHIVENPLHSDKSAVSKTPSTISRIVKDPVDRFIDLLVEGEETIIKQSPQSSQLNLHFVLRKKWRVEHYHL